ncbi:hypothetical protein ACFL4K_00460 [Candidatus Neomarinimicrobiota bacterium]
MESWIPLSGQTRVLCGARTEIAVTGFAGFQVNGYLSFHEIKDISHPEGRGDVKHPSDNLNASPSVGSDLSSVDRIVQGAFFRDRSY